MNNCTAKGTFLCECTGSAFVAGNTVSLEFIWPGPAPRAGQFFLIKPRRTGVFLGRPVSVAGWKPRGTKISDEPVDPSASIDPSGSIDPGADENSSRRIKVDRRINTKGRVDIDRRLNTDRRLIGGGILRFLVVRRGGGSRELVDLRPGEQAELTGPLGNFWAHVNTFTTNSPDVTGKISGDMIALVGGGVGIAPLVAYAAELGKKPFDFYAGFRTGSFGLEHVNPKSLIIATEDGSQGIKGQILDFFSPSGYGAVFACGPEPMLKSVADACIMNEVPCFISIERHMACGVGACLGCTVKTTRGNRRCCSDGPIFNAEEVLFDEST